MFFGMGNYTTYRYPGNFKTPATEKEFRMWEQLVLNSTIGVIKIDHRYRLEQRWVNGLYHTEFRYRINTLVPVNHTSLQAHTFFASASDEVFFYH